jgi:hypothetical protein
MAARSFATRHIHSRPTQTTGGQRAIAGFLFQILRSVQLGLRVSAQLYCTGANDSEQMMQLVLEPGDGGDHRIEEHRISTVEQVKMRRGGTPWSSGAIAREVFPDLMKAAKSESAQRFVFVTDNPHGLGFLRQFLESRRATGDVGIKYAWGRRRLTASEFADHLAREAGTVADDATFVRLLDNLSIEVIDTVSAESEVETLMGNLLAPGQNAASKRHELTARLLAAAAAGQSIDAATLLALIDPQAIVRLGHVQSLPQMLGAALARDCAALGYIDAQQARTGTLVPDAALTIYSGESGQGKTWSLCQSALAQRTRGEWAIVMRAPNNLQDIVEALNERLWRPAYAERVSPQILAQRLRHASPSTFWLTLYIDDLQSRSLAEEVARLDWYIHGIRVVISAQPRITLAIRRQHPGAIVQPIGNFTGADLRRFLAHHGRETALDTVPDDAFELLLKPIHASIFVQLPQRSGWSDASEYELFKAYWTFATSEARDQYDHRSDRDALVALAGSLLGATPRYPWTFRDARAAGLDDTAIARLEAVGLVRWADADALQFAADRMLNWAVAEFIASRAEDERWTAARLDAELARIESIATLHGEPVGQRLGYVFLDLIWLLAGYGDAQLLADALLAHMHRLPHEWRGEGMWQDQLATIGGRLIPALEVLALREFDENDWDIPGNIPVALAAVAEVDRGAVLAMTARLLAAALNSAITVALGVVGRLPAPELLDPLWREHIERERAFDVSTRSPDEGNDRIDKMLRRDASWKAVRRAVARDRDWLDRQIERSADPFELDQLLWLATNDDCLSDEDAEHIWTRHQAHWLAHLPGDSKAMIKALGHFADTAHKDWLDRVPLGRDDWMSARVLSSRARIDRSGALRQISERTEDYLWSAADWWIAELAAGDADGLSRALMENAGKGDSPLTDIVLCYEKAPELIDDATLDWVLDQFALALGKYNDAAADGELGPLAHPLRFLTRLVEPWQFDRIAGRAGTALEQELVRMAIRRTGRTSRLRDSDGADCERLLAMIAGEGFDQLVLAELQRRDVFGREDGYRAAHWSDGEAVALMLASSQEPDTSEPYRSVIAMQAFAVHQCDDALERMVREGAPIYVNAAEMRSAEGRSTEGLRRRIETLIASGDAEDQRVAARLAGFLTEASQAEILLPLFTDPAVDQSVKQAIIGTFNALGFYDSSMLAAALRLLGGRIDDEAQFLAAYLASQGDGDARRAVAEWLNNLDMGTWSRSRDAFIAPLLKDEQSRSAVIDFLQRSRARGHLLIDFRYLRLLAEHDDPRAHSELVEAAYREPRATLLATGAAIAYLRTLDRDEAFFAARRYFVRHQSDDAMALMLDIDPAAAAPLLVQAYRSAKPSFRAAIARQLRTRLAASERKQIIDALAACSASQDRLIAIELAGWMPPGMQFDWLEIFACRGSARIRSAAHASLRKRSREAAAMAHLSAMDRSRKPLKWARLQTIFMCVDPHFLWSRDDPASLQAFIDATPAEFLVEARQLHKRATKKREDAEKRADKDAV